MSEESEEIPPARRRVRFSMLRSFAAADFLTLGNAACGMVAIFACLNYLSGGHEATLWIAFGLLPVALVLDFLDGAVARWRRKHSPLGADLDSLADIVSFGVAPAVIGYTLGMQGGWDTAVLVFFVVCGIARLARYNVTSEELMGDSGKVPYYEGTPIPTSLLLVVALAVAFATGNVGAQMWGGAYEVGPWTLHPLVLIYGVSGSAMISQTLRIPKP